VGIDNKGRGSRVRQSHQPNANRTCSQRKLLSESQIKLESLAVGLTVAERTNQFQNTILLIGRVPKALALVSVFQLGSSFHIVGCKCYVHKDYRFIDYLKVKRTVNYTLGDMNNGRFINYMLFTFFA